jgi:hypothetical protein
MICARMMRPMPALEFPRSHVASLHKLAVRLLDSRKAGSDVDALARTLLAGFHETAVRSGLDRLLVDLGIEDRETLFDHPSLFPALVTQLGTIDLDGGGPRNAKPGQLVDGLVAALGLTVIDDVERQITLDDSVRSEVAAALVAVAEVELGVPKLRETIIARGHAACEPRYHGAFDRITAQLDDRGMRVIRQPKVPLDAVQAVQRVLFETRNAVIGEVVRAAIDRALPALARASADAAARIDQPITLRLTPRDVAVVRACDAGVPKVPVAIVESVLESLAVLCQITFRSPERAVRPYAASQTFVVGELLEHPKFGRGSVTSSDVQRIEVEFPDGPHTLVHARVAPPR